MDESYVTEILRAMPSELTPEAFMARAKPDINAGYGAEVEEAFGRRFKIAAMIDGTGTNNRIIYEPR
jgi:hypothetical protein